MTGNTPAERFLKHDQWDVISRAIERYNADEISSLHALGLIAQGCLALEADRQLALAAAGEKKDG